MTLYRIITNKFTCGIEVDENNIIKNTAPILKKFINQPFSNLKGWIIKIGGKIELIY